MPAFRFRGKTYNNPAELTLDLLGGKWKMPILWRVKDGPRRYGELRKNIPKVTHKMLAQQLRELERDGLVKRKVYATVPPKVEYSITTLGSTTIPLIESLRTWGESIRKGGDRS